MIRASNHDPKQPHHLILCAFGGCMIGMVESVAIAWTNPDTVYVVMFGWLGVGAASAWPLWLIVRRKPRWITPLVLTAGVCGAGIASACSPTLRGAFMLPALSVVVATAVLRHRLPDDPVPGCCVSCGYDLRGLDRSRCPECGRSFDASQLPEAHRDTSPLQRHV